MSKTEKILSGITNILYIIFTAVIVIQLILSISMIGDKGPDFFSLTMMTAIAFFGAHFLFRKYISEIIYKSSIRSKVILGIVLVAIALVILGIYPTFSTGSGKYDEARVLHELSNMERLVFIPVAVLRGIFKGMKDSEIKMREAPMNDS